MREKIISENRDFRGIWIPAKLYLSTDFTPNEKFLMIEIYSLCKNGICYASNRHFAEFLGLSSSMIDKMMRKLRDNNYIRSEIIYKGNSKQIDKRVMRLTQKFYDEFINEHENTESDLSENIEPPTGINYDTPTGIDCEEKYNNIKYNNISNTYKEQAISKEIVEEQAFSLKKKDEHNSTQNKSYSELRQLENNMIDKAKIICEEQLNFDGECVKNITDTIKYFFEKYTEQTGKIHPIMKTETLLNIVVKLFDGPLDEYNHFSVLIYDKGAYRAMIDRYFSTDYGEVDGKKVTHTLPHFVSGDIFINLAYHTIEI